MEAREKLPDTDPNTLLAAKQHERLRTRNPRDPAFYSSCMMFTKDVTWKALPGAIAQDNLTADVGWFTHVFMKSVLKTDRPWLLKDAWQVSTPLELHI